MRRPLVLIVDGNALNRFRLGELLSLAHVRSVAVDTPDAALAVLAQAAESARSFQVVLIDADLPGVDFARRIRGRGIHPVLIVGEHDTEPDARLTGDVPVLRRPVLGPHLVDVLSALISGSLATTES
jgi:CheY-like chemotaxis protein